MFVLMIASHGVLDALTRGGENVPFFWPLEGRYGNWGLIPVSDMALELPDPWKSRALRSEMVGIWVPIVLVVGAAMGYRRVRRRM